MTDKMREAFGNCSLHDGYGDAMLLEENRKWFIAGWQAAKSAPDEEAITCDTCGAVTDNPWYSSRGTNRHYHECDKCMEQAAKSVPEGWIPVSERLPEHNTHVVGLWQYPNGATGFDIVFYEYDGEWLCESVRPPDYWCALPYAEPPAAPQKNEVE